MTNTNDSLDLIKNGNSLQKGLDCCKSFRIASAKIDSFIAVVAVKDSAYKSLMHDFTEQYLMKTELVGLVQSLDSARVINENTIATYNLYYTMPFLKRIFKRPQIK